MLLVNTGNINGNYMFNRLGDGKGKLAITRSDLHENIVWLKETRQ